MSVNYPEADREISLLFLSINYSIISKNLLER